MLTELGQAELPVQRTWRLNERHYGAMQGMSREEAKQAVRSRAVQCMADRLCSSPAGGRRRATPAIREMIRATRELPSAVLPRAESMQDTLQRVMPCWEEDIGPALRAGKRVLVVAHKTTVRVMRKQLEGISDEDICSITIETGKPIAYQLDASLAVLWQGSLIPGGRFKRLAQAALARWIYGNRPADRV